MSKAHGTTSPNWRNPVVAAPVMAVLVHILLQDHCRARFLQRVRQNVATIAREIALTISSA
eukprot:2032261-Amphidinium_carterae.1